MRLQWIPITHKLDDRTLEIHYWTSDGNFFKRGETIKFCEGCGRWVREYDYNHYCRRGMHEFSEEVSLDDIKKGSPKMS